jgi:DNA-binding MarR family transcriptional regulator
MAQESADPAGGDVEAVMAAARVLVAVSAQSVAEVEDVVSLPQLRVLVVLASRGPLNLAAVAGRLGVHSSNATRACDRLVAAGLLDRRDDPADRRYLQLDLTDEGRRLVERVMDHRREAIMDALGRMSAVERVALVPVLRSFAAAAGEVEDERMWLMGWTTGPRRRPAATSRHRGRRPAAKVAPFPEG